MDLGGKTLFITGASRGIGLAVALRAARDGANIAIAAKTAEPHRHLPGTIHSAAEKVRAAGGQALPLVVDVRDEASIQAGVQRTVEAFGGIDICINNASAVSLSKIEDTDAKRYDLMQQVNGRGTFLVSRACLPHLRRAANPHILNMAPPLNLDPKWFSGHVAYTISKYGMSMCTLGMAAELAAEGIAVNALWPRIGVATAAIEFAFADASELARCRKPEIMADAAHAVLTRPAREATGRFFIDDEVLYAAGVRDFSVYRNDPDATPRLGMFLPDDAEPPPGVDMAGATRPVRG
jgi:citronellol/citronellal dehydrogenase